MEGWTEVVTEPLGLAGFALFLVFSVLSKTAGVEKYRWLPKAFIAMAVIALVGGLALAFSSARDGRSGGGTPATVIQSTEGDASPAIQGVEGDVRLKIDRDSGGGGNP